MKFVLRDAAARFKSVVDESRAVVLVGGTLSPIDELARALFPSAAPVGSKIASETVVDKPLQSPLQPLQPPKTLSSLSLGHVVPKESLLPIAVGKGHHAHGVARDPVQQRLGRFEHAEQRVRLARGLAGDRGSGGEQRRELHCDRPRCMLARSRRRDGALHSVQ